MVWDPQRQQALRMVGIIIVIIIIIIIVVVVVVVVVVVKINNEKEIKMVSYSSVRESRSLSGPCQRS